MAECAASAVDLASLWHDMHERHIIHHVSLKKVLHTCTHTHTVDDDDDKILAPALAAPDVLFALHDLLDELGIEEVRSTAYATDAPAMELARFMR